MKTPYKSSFGHNGKPRLGDMETFLSPRQIKMSTSHKNVKIVLNF
jgi:hypothetical protein